MTNDLFLTKEQQLINWMRDKIYFASHDVIEWGCKNYYNRSDRTKRDLVLAGKVKKLSTDEKLFRGFKCKDDVYEWIPVNSKKS